MKKQNDGWRETLIALGESLIEVLRAELAVIGEVWKRSGRELGIALGMFVVAAYVALICLPALLILALVAGLEIWLPLWAAALVAAALVAAIVFLLARLALSRLVKRCENPVATVQYRFADHIAWWNERVLLGEESPGEPDEATADPEGPGKDVTGDRSADQPPPGS